MAANKQQDTTALLGTLPDTITAQECQTLMCLHTKHSHEFLIWSDVNGRKKFVSESCLNLTGFSAQEIMAHDTLLEKHIHPDDLPLWQDRHRADTKHHTMQFRLIKPDDTISWFEHSYTPIFDNSGTVISHIGNFVDITTIKQAEQTSQKLALALEQNDYGVAITSMDGVIEYANPAFIAMHSSTIKTMPGDIFQLFQPGSNQANIIRSTLAQDNIWRDEYRSSISDKWLSIRISPIFDEHSNLSNCLIATFDITQRISDKAQMQQQHNQLQALFKNVENAKHEWERSLDCIEEVVLLVDRTDRVVRSNKAIHTLYGLDITDVLGQNWRTLLPTELAQLEQLPSEGQFHDQQHDKWLQFRIFPFREGAFTTEIAKIVTIHDITAMWQLNQDLADAYDQMKSAQGQMVHQEKMASIGQLAAGVAHEINNPTGFIASNLTSLAKYTRRLSEHIEFLEKLIQNSGHQDAIDEVKQHQKQLKLHFIQEDIADLIEESLEGAQRITKIVQNLKSFSRVDDTASAVSNLHECLDAALSIGWNEIKYTAEVKKDYQDIPDIYCSAQELNQVFLNLLVNAAQAMSGAGEKNTGEILISTATEDPWVVIKISDNGSGMPKNILSRIFEPFFTTKDVGKGTGLGLSICYDIIQKHHGKLTVESEVGVGTTFTIKLPIITTKPDKTTN